MKLLYHGVGYSFLGDSTVKSGSVHFHAQYVKFPAVLHLCQCFVLSLILKFQTFWRL